VRLLRAPSRPHDVYIPENRVLYVHICITSVRENRLPLNLRRTSKKIVTIFNADTRITIHDSRIAVKSFSVFFFCGGMFNFFDRKIKRIAVFAVLT